jgi:hypothetical protein
MHLFVQDRKTVARRSQTGNPEEIRLKLLELLHDLPERLRSGSVGEQVCGLVEVNLELRALGASIGASLAPHDAGSGRARLLAYLRNQVGRIVHTDELMIVAGITDYARRIRELRADLGWPIISGLAVRDMRADAAPGVPERRIEQISSMVPEEYMLIEDVCDSDAVRRWAEAPAIRDASDDPKDAILTYLRRAAGKRVTAEELRYVGGNTSSWPAAVRTLRQEGWAIAAKGEPDCDLPWGIYVFSSDRTV